VDALAELIDEEVAVPVSYPLRVVITVTVEAVPEATPEIVISPVEEFTLTVLPKEWVTDQVVRVS